MKFTKIVATIGPKTCTTAKLKSLYKAGMDIARLNGSHNSLDWHKQTIKSIREQLPMVPILLDIPGKKIRTENLKLEPSFNANDQIILTCDDNYTGTNKVPVTNKKLYLYLKKGEKILADDGTLSFIVDKIIKKDIYCLSLNKGKLRSKKGINVPNISFKQELLTNKDKKFLDFSKSVGVDFVGISFVESKKHIEKIQKYLNSNSPKIIAKIENREGLKNKDQIISSCDAIMIDRGDLSVETDLDSIAISQKEIISKANLYFKPVIVATEMLHSMIDNPFPTKAEVTDISNSVLDGCSATMLSGETAIGSFPEKSVKKMKEISFVSSQHVRKKQVTKSRNSEKSLIRNHMAKAVAHLCKNTPITKVVAITKSGFAARSLSLLQISQPIIAVSDNLENARTFNLFPGTQGIFLDISFSKKNTDHIILCLKKLWQNNILNDKDLVVVIGLSYPKSGNRFNHIQLHLINDLVEIFNWKR